MTGYKTVDHLVGYPGRTTRPPSSPRGASDASIVVRKDVYSQTNISESKISQSFMGKKVFSLVY